MTVTAVHGIAAEVVEVAGAHVVRAPGPPALDSASVFRCDRARRGGRARWSSSAPHHRGSAARSVGYSRGAVRGVNRLASDAGAWITGQTVNANDAVAHAMDHRVEGRYLMLIRWLLPTLIYVLAVGGLGVTSKLALRSLQWQDLIMWTGIGYVLVAGVLIGLGQARPRFVANTPWAIASGAMAIGGLISFYVALNTGEASKVVPVSAAYPAVTVVLSALVLSERVSPVRAGGLVLVIAGVIVLTAVR